MVSLIFVWSLQVTVVLTPVARYLNIPGRNFRSTWLNTQVNLTVVNKVIGSYSVLCGKMTFNNPFFNAAATFTCQVCKKEFKKVDSLRRHKRIHASHKPVLVCPRVDCQAYFSTTFNLQHHIRKVHLDLLKYKCSFPDCPRMFAMRVCIEQPFSNCKCLPTWMIWCGSEMYWV